MRLQADLRETIIAAERAALDRWIKFDPEGYLELSAREVTYFDPYREKRIDGLEELTSVLTPIKQFKGAVAETHYDMIDPKVQCHGDIAVLSFNLINYGKVGGRPEAVLARWNATQVYRQIEGQWKIIHSHWSYSKPELKQPEQT